MIAGKTQKAINAAWGIMRRGKINSLERRIYLLDTLAKTIMMYGVETWGWQAWKVLEKTQGRYIKMIMGLDTNTPDYIWRLESGRNRIATQAWTRATRYLVQVGKMGEERWPKICLKEELRAIQNNTASRWGKELKKAFSEVGDGTILEELRIGDLMEQNAEHLQNAERVKNEQDTQLDWIRVDRSKYWERYKDIKTRVGREEYWTKREIRETDKEQWTRLRCGNVGKSGNKGLGEIKCRVCGDGKEEIGHIWECKTMESKAGPNLIEKIRTLQQEGKLGNGIAETLKGNPIAEMCRYSRIF